jgi:hypothetical protein
MPDIPHRHTHDGQCEPDLSQSPAVVLTGTLNFSVRFWKHCSAGLRNELNHAKAKKNGLGRGGPPKVRGNHVKDQ